jgi:hypothetical protein
VQSEKSKGVTEDVHELAHVILRDRNNRFFCEGAATYFQERYGGKKAFPKFFG